MEASHNGNWKRVALKGVMGKRISLEELKNVLFVTAGITPYTAIPAERAD